MATTFKTLTNNDMTTTRTLLHEAIPVTGTIVSGTYDESAAATSNIKNYSHGMFQSVYDYPYLSSSANQIFDITVGYASDSALSGTSAGHVQNSKKINIYQQMAQVLVGYDQNGNIQNFDRDGDLAAGGDKIKEAVFINFARLLSKDEIKKESFVLTALTGGTTAPSGRTDNLTISDYGAATSYKINSPSGEYGILYTGSAAAPGTGVGLVFYQAGVAVLTSSIFSQYGAGSAFCDFGSPVEFKTVAEGGIEASLTGSAITASADGFRNRLVNIQFNNTTELNSTIYFCRANHNDFNYSSNPTYLEDSKIRVKNNSIDSPVSYITSVGLYSADNELLAVAKLSEPIKKTPETELTLRVRLDY